MNQCAEKAALITGARRGIRARGYALHRGVKKERRRHLHRSCVSAQLPSDKRRSR